MADLIFLAMMVVTVGGAIMAVEADEIVYGAIGLAASLFGVAALFFLLNAPYVAVFQITVYVGAVAVLFCSPSCSSEPRSGRRRFRQSR